MLKCKDIAHLSSDYIDKSLPLMTRLNMRLHLFMCVHCRNLIKNLKSTVNVSAAIEKQRLKDQPRCSDKVLALIKNQTKGKKSSY